MGGRALTIRTDLPAAELRRLARREEDRGSYRTARPTSPGPAGAVGRGAKGDTEAAGAGWPRRGGHGPERLDLVRAVPRGRTALGRVVPPLAHGQADAPARPVVAEGAALAPEGGCGGARGVRKGGLQAALDDARAAHADKRLTLWFMDGWTHCVQQIRAEGARP